MIKTITLSRYTSLVFLASAFVACAGRTSADRGETGTLATAASALTGTCRASGSDALVDDMEDGNHYITNGEGRLGVWFTFNPGGTCQQTPAVDLSRRFTMASGGNGGSQFAAATTGRACTSATWSGGGMGVHFLSSYDDPSDTSVGCSGGYDASAYAGLSFAIRSSVPVRLQVCTTSVTDANCHGYDIATRGEGWRMVTVPWLQLLQEDWGPATKRVPFDPKEIVGIQFKASQPDFDFAVDDLRFTAPSTPGGGDGPSTAYYAFKVGGVTEAVVRTEYENWKDRHLVRCGDGSADARYRDSLGVSEGTGYGMLMAVLAGDRQTFDALLKGFEARKNGRGMMKWRFEVCGGAITDGAATDGDLDIAMALVQADQKWGGYRAKAEVLISALKQFGTSECDGLTVLRPGDNWGGCADVVDRRVNPSYFSPAYYRVFAKYVPNQEDFWNDLVVDTYVLLDKYQTRKDGLFPDWGYADGTALDNYWYDACRVPWRIATDYAWSGDPRAKAVLTRMHDTVAQRGGPSAATSEKNSCFMGGFALTATAVSQAQTDTWFSQWIGNVPQGPDPSMGDNPYFQGSLRVLLLALAGGHSVPRAAVSDVPQGPGGGGTTSGGSSGGTTGGTSGGAGGGTSGGTTGSGGATALVDDFRACDAQSRSPLGTFWYAYDDSGNGGTSTSTVAVSKVGGVDGAECALRWQGRVTTAYAYGYGGMGLELGMLKLGGYRKLALKVRGDGASYRAKLPMRAQETSREYNYYGTSFRCGDGTSGWQEVLLDLRSMQQEAGWGVPRPLVLDDVKSLQVQTIGQPIDAFRCDVGSVVAVP